MGHVCRKTNNRGMRMFSGVVSACAALMTAAVALPASASADPAPFPGAVPGMSSPASVVQTPDGGIWVADDGRGVCRVALAPTPALVDSHWCQPEAPDVPGEEHPEAPHDELAAEPVVPDVIPAGDRPTGVAGLVFDAATDNFYAADVASAAGGVWRLHLDRATGAIDHGELIAAGGVRVQAVALAPATTPGAEPDVLYLTKRGGVLMRIADPATGPKYPQRIGVLGDALEVGGMVATDDSVYLADGGVARVGLTAGGITSAERLPGFDDVSVSAVAVDRASGRLYAGSSNLDGEDLVKVVDLATGATEPYELGFAAVTALGIDADGRLLVGDDPGVADGSGIAGLGRLWRVDVQPLGRPQAQITAGPARLSNAPTVGIAYGSRDGATFECRLDDGAYEACAGTGSGERSYTDLPDGEHRFWVRATDSVTGLPASRRFRLDRAAPDVTVVLTETDVVEGGTPRIRFAKYENAVTYTCTLDGVPFEPCGWYEPLPTLTPGTHVLRVVGVDAAGNASDPAFATIRVRAASSSVAGVVATSPRTPPAAGRPAPAATPAAPAAAAPVAGEVVVDRKPLLWPFTLRFRSASAPMRFGLKASPEAADVRVSVKNWLGRTVITRVVTVRPNAANRVNLTLTRGEQRRLKPGRYLVTAVLRTARGTKGNPQTHWLRVRPGGRS
jgi:hypothetical protein